VPPPGEQSHEPADPTAGSAFDAIADREVLVAALERRGVAVTAEHTGLTIEGRDESVYDQVRDALVEAEAPLRRMAPRRRALTELFEA
jgi:hypothetical protein